MAVSGSAPSAPATRHRRPRASRVRTPTRTATATATSARTAPTHARARSRAHARLAASNKNVDAEAKQQAAEGNRQQNQNRDQNRADQQALDGAGGRRNRQRNKRRGQPAGDEFEPEIGEDDVLIPIAGILDVLDNYAFVRTSGYLPGTSDVYVSLGQVKKYNLRKGDAVVGAIKQPREGEQSSRQKYNALVKVDSINGLSVEDAATRVEFGKLTPLYPQERLRLETAPEKLTQRIIDLVAPIGKGQRGLIVAPPKAGKTIVLQQIANAIATNNPEVHLMVVLVDERPEEVTDMQRTVAARSSPRRSTAPPKTTPRSPSSRSSAPSASSSSVATSSCCSTRSPASAAPTTSRRPTSGRVLTGGVDASALYPPKRFFGAARNIENGGSLTILATALVETGSKMDEVIFEEFKGTGNSELRLSRQLADKRIFPAVDVNASSTRREEMLLSADEVKITWKLRRALAGLDPQQALEVVLGKLKETQSNVEFLVQMQKSIPHADRRRPQPRARQQHPLTVDVTHVSESACSTPCKALIDEHKAVQEELSDPAVHADAARAKKVNRRYAELSQIVAANDAWVAASDDLDAARELAQGGRGVRRGGPGARGAARGDAGEAAASADPARPRRRARRDHGDQGRRGRRRERAVRGRPAAHVPAVRGVQGLEDRAARAQRVRPRRLQGRPGRDQGSSTDPRRASGRTSSTRAACTACSACRRPSRRDASTPRRPACSSSPRSTSPTRSRSTRTTSRSTCSARRGPGGQSVNTTDSAVRITHLPTGIVVSMQNEKSQLQNREAGMRVLRARMLAKQQEELDAAASDARKSQIRGMDRSERIRTYNFPENRIADHRTGYKAYNLDQVMDGALEPIIESAIQADEEARLAALGEA